MKRLRTGMALVLALTLALALALPAAAANKTQSINITYRAISIVVDGEKIAPTDVSGNSVEPFIYADTTYLPVRAVAGALGLNADWDEDTSTVTLTSGGTVQKGSGTPAATKANKAVSIAYRDIKIVIDGETITPKDANGTVVEPFILGGTTYLPVRAVATALGEEVTWNAATNSVFLGEQPELAWLLQTETHYFDDGSVNEMVKYSYDAKGTLIRKEFSPQSYLLYRYDAQGKLTQEEEYSDGDKIWTTAYSYDTRGDLVKATDRNSSGGLMTEESLRYTYDAKGLITGIESSQKGGEAEFATTTAYSYDAKGQLVGEKTVESYYYRGEFTSTTTTTIGYGYDARGLCESAEIHIEEAFPTVNDATVVASTYNTVITTTYSYDSADRLIQEVELYQEENAQPIKTTATYTYDQNGNLARMDYDYGWVIYTYTAIPV